MNTALRATEELMAKVRAYGVRVTSRIGGTEFAGFLLGPPERPDLVTEFVLLQGQRVSAVDFTCDEDAVEETAILAATRHPDLCLRAVIHRHPGAAYHSATDVRYIEGELMPALADALFMGGKIERAVWSQPVCALAGQEVPDGDGLGIRGAADAELSLVGTDRVSSVYSVVFPMHDGPLYCVCLRVRSTPSIGAEGAGRIVERGTHELPVELAPAAELGCAAARIASGPAIDAEIERAIRRHYPESYPSWTEHGATTSRAWDEDEDEAEDGRWSVAGSLPPRDRRSRLLALLRDADDCIATVLGRLPADYESRVTRGLWDDVRGRLDALIGASFEDEGPDASEQEGRA